MTIIPEDGDGTGFPDAYIPIAGNYFLENGHSLDPTITRLKNIDSEREGVRIALHGGKHPFDDKKGVAQQAIIDFVCAPERDGLERQGSDKDEETDATNDDDANENNNSNEKTNDASSLRFISYGHEEDLGSDVLRLEWLTKYACEGFEDDEESKSNSWGFFTWLIILCVSRSPSSVFTAELN